jgi:hypothetical protein
LDQKNAPIIAPGEVAYVDILLGNHSNEHRSYRIDGQFSTNSNVFVTTPTGIKTDITATRFFSGEATTVNNGYIASFTPEAPGAYIVTAESDGTRTSSGVTTRTLRNAKSFVAVGDLPIIDRIKLLKGFSAVINKDRVELIPLFHRAAITANREASVQLLLKGEPSPDIEVSLIRRSNNTEPQTVHTVSKGVATFKLGPADYYLFRAKPVTKESEPNNDTGINYETMMSIVF